ncbi:MAG: hypothetical protein ACPH5G_07310, partial [Pseudooceanicola atlanticus]
RPGQGDGAEGRQTGAGPVMPVASWFAVAFAAAIPLVMLAERRAGRRGTVPALAITLAAIATGVAGIAA